MWRIRPKHIEKNGKIWGVLYFLFLAITSFTNSHLQGEAIHSELTANQSVPCLSVNTIQTMTLEEKVGQLLMVNFHGEVANNEAKTLIQDTKVGGIIYYNWSNGLSSPEQVQDLSFGLQKLTQNNRIPIPLFIAVDQEGGVVARLNNGFTTFPGNRALGETHDPNLAEMAAFSIGQELQAVGVNMNFAPVVDVNINPRNPIIGVRSFGDDPETVLTFGEKALHGYRQANIIASLKHFPGHGDVEIDSHEDLPIIHKSMKELEQVELLPFAKLASSSDMIMTAHLLVPALDKENCSTLSEKTLAYLKNTIGFKGVIITDSLVMEGVLKKCHTVDEAAIQALNAGCDILLLGGKQLIGGHANLALTVSDIHRIHGSIVNAVKSDRISEARLNQAVEKILRLKKRYLNSTISQSRPDLDHLVNTLNHQELTQKIASLALKVLLNSPDAISPLNQKKIVVFSPQLLRDSIKKTTLHEIGKTTDLWFFCNLNPSNEEIEAAKQNAQAADVLLICSYNAWKNPSQVALIQSLLNTGKPVILLVMRDPLDTFFFPKANLIFNTFSPTAPSIEAVCNQLKERY
jgi:beta-N-acetylhexosaminidase